MGNALLSGKIAVITGAASGIGRGSALVFARQGAKVAIADINTQGGEETVELVRQAGGEAFFIQTDVSNKEQAAAMVGKVVERWGRLDCALNNAGIDGSMGATADCTEETWQNTIAVNLTGVFLCMKYEIQQMLKQGGGAIVNIASVAGLVGYPGLPAYVASKHGVVGLTKNAAIEYAKQGIRVNAVCPGAIRTPMLEDAIRQGLIPEEQLAGLAPLGRLGLPEEIGEAAAWLCSEKSSFMIGQAVPVDGGWVAM